MSNYLNLIKKRIQTKPKITIQSKIKHKKILRKMKIKQFEKPIFGMERAELLKYFGTKRSKKLKMNILVRSMLYQTYKNIKLEKIPQLTGNIRTFWYTNIQPVMYRGGRRGDHYDILITELKRLVVDERLMNYNDFGFEDASRQFRITGTKNPHIIFFAEKEGRYTLLQRLNFEYDINIIAFGGQVSALSVEYFVKELLKKNTPKTEIITFGAVDYDPAGDLISKSFLEKLKVFGFKKVKYIPLILPNKLNHRRLMLNKIPLSRRKKTKTINTKWFNKTKGIKNRKYTLESDAFTDKDLKKDFAKQVIPYLQTPREIVLKLFYIDIIKNLTKQLILKRVKEITKKKGTFKNLKKLPQKIREYLLLSGYKK